MDDLWRTWAGTRVDGVELKAIGAEDAGRQDGEREFMGGGSRHGRFRHVAALALASVVVVVSATPASGIIDPTEQCWTISGTVMDPYSRAVPGALIATNRGCEGPVGVVSNSSGNYSFSASGNLLGASVAITISKSGFTQQDKYVSASAIGAQSNGSSEMESSSASASNAGGVLDPDDVVGTSDVVLQYDPGATVTPALRSGETLVLSARNPAPPATGSSAPGAHVRVDLPDGSTQQLVAGATDTEGFTTWTGSYAVPAAWADGSYAAVFCVVEQSFIGSCAQAEQAHESGTNVLVSPLQTKIYVVDNTAPVITGVAPAIESNTQIRRPTIRAYPTDSGSGLAIDSLEIWLDGELLDSGVSSTATEVDLTLGEHSASFVAEDLVGNRASLTWGFAVVEYVGGSAPASLGDEYSLSFPPGTSQVTFTSVRMDLAESSFSLSGSIHRGLGSVETRYPFGQLETTFQQALIASTISAGTSDEFEVRPFAVLAPSDVVIEGYLPARSRVRGSISVPVPETFQLTGGTASLTLPMASGITYSLAADDPLDSPLDCGQENDCQIEGIVACEFMPSTTTGCGGGRPEVFLKSGSQNLGQVLGPRPIGALDPGATASPSRNRVLDMRPTDPEGCGGTPELGITCSDLTDPPGSTPPDRHWSDFFIGAPHIAGAPSLLAAFGTHRYWGIQIPQTPMRVVTWQQSDLRGGWVPCRTGSQERIRAQLTRGGNFVEATQGATLYTRPIVASAGLQNEAIPETLIAMEMGDEVPDANGLAQQAYAVKSALNVAALVDPGTTLLQGDYIPEPSVTYRRSESDYRRIDRLEGVQGAANLWKPLESVATNVAEVFTGSEFVAQSEQFRFRAGLYFLFDYDTSDCEAP